MGRLDDELRTGKFQRVYLFYGPEDYLKSYYRSMIRRACLAPDDTFNINIYDGQDPDVDAMIDQAQTMPLFAERRLILAEDTGLFKKDGDALAAALSKIPESTILVFTESEIDRRSKLYKAVQKEGYVQECAYLKEQDMSTWILRRLAKNGRRITRSGMEQLLLCIGDDMGSAVGEMEKLIAWTQGREGITKEDVEAVCTVRIESRIFEMIDAVAAQNAVKALALYRALLALREPPMRILYLISRQFSIMLQVKDLRQQGLDKDTIAQKMGVKSFIVSRSLRQADMFSKERIERLLRICIDTETRVKTGNMTDQLAVETVIVTASRRNTKK